MELNGASIAKCTLLLILGSQQPPPLCTIRIYCCFLYLHKTIGHKRARGAHCACQSHAQAWICLAAQIARPEQERKGQRTGETGKSPALLIGAIRYQEHSRMKFARLMASVICLVDRHRPKVKAYLKAVTWEQSQGFPNFWAFLAN